MLLIFDCCEHAIDSAATLAEAVFQETERVSVLATSREPLRADGEHVFHLPPLHMPPDRSR